MGMQSNVSGESINLGNGDAMSVQELADMISPNQTRVPERPFDLVGTLANTCKAKQLLNWEAKLNMREEMPKLIHLNKFAEANLNHKSSQDSRNIAAKARYKINKSKFSVFG